jgi:putative RNA 2'-phosphotransferase
MQMRSLTRHEEQIGRFLVMVLRHKPDVLELKLDAAGWVSVLSLLESLGRKGTPLFREQLELIAAQNDKRRFEFSADGQSIRASQGHSIKVELGYPAAVPPEVLYHGTTNGVVDSIRQQGLIKGQRHAVHISSDEATALRVGSRHGTPIVLKIRAGAMHRGGFVFFLSTNGVWLTERVPPSFIDFPK